MFINYLIFNWNIMIELFTNMQKHVMDFISGFKFLFFVLQIFFSPLL